LETPLFTPPCNAIPYHTQPNPFTEYAEHKGKYVISLYFPSVFFRVFHGYIPSEFLNYASHMLGNIWLGTKTLKTTPGQKNFLAAKSPSLHGKTLPCSKKGFLATIFFAQKGCFLSLQSKKDSLQRFFILFLDRKWGKIGKNARFSIHL
jgi:hypothetical protein